MSSSTSTTERAAWRRALWVYPVVSLAAAALALALIVVIDPYDTGRFTLLDGYGVPAAFGQRLTAASLGREPDTDAAIIGNSTIQLLDPARLLEQTNWRFVSLAMTLTRPVEQLAVARWLARHHDGKRKPALKALVIGLDKTWCQADGKIDTPQPFPHWLYGDNTLDYVAALFNMRSINAAIRKLKVISGAEPRMRPDGYRNLELLLAADGPAVGADLDLSVHATAASGTGNFAAVRMLSEFVPMVPATTVVVLVFVPHYAADLPLSDTAASREIDQCKAAYGEIAANRPNTVILDYLKTDGLTSDRGNFWDRLHYRMPIARLIETDIAAVVRGAHG